MFKKIATILGSTLFGTVLFAKVKEKRSYKSFLQEKMIFQRILEPCASMYI